MASTCAPSTFWRKLARRHHWLLPIKGRQKATYTERPISNPSKEGTRTAQSEGSSTLRLRYLSFPCKLVGAFARTQQKRPYATQVGSSIIIWGCGDLLAQNFGGADYDPWRTLRHLTIGITVSIPGYIWCGVLIGLELTIALMEKAGSYILGSLLTMPRRSSLWLPRSSSTRLYLHLRSAPTSLGCSHCCPEVLFRELPSISSTLCPSA